MNTLKLPQIQDKKFTLIELLVVIAIIGILASLLLPSLGKARQSAKLAVCSGTMKQMGVALNMYPDDNDQKYVYAQKKGTVMIWDDALFDYLGYNFSESVLKGVQLNKTDYPNLSKRNPFKCAADDIVRLNNMNTRSYVYNGATNDNKFALAGLGDQNTQGVLVSSVVDPSNCIAFMQPGNTDNQRLGAQGEAFLDLNNSGIDALNDENTHQKVVRYNTSFADGSVRLLHQALVQKSLYRNPANY